MPLWEIYVLSVVSRGLAWHQDALSADDRPPGVVVFRRIRFLGFGFEVGGFDPLEAMRKEKSII